MKNIALSVALSSLMCATLAAGPASVTGTYVEARTAEVFAGACIMNGEAATAGREALLAWKVDRGQVDGVTLDGLAVIAAITSDTNLGIHEIGGDFTPARAAIYVDARATAAQRKALVAMVTSLSGNLIGRVVQETTAPIQFVDRGHQIDVSTDAVKLSVEKHLTHDPSCGNKQWFNPLARVEHAEMGMTNQNAFTGPALCDKWSDPNKASSFFGTFSFQQ
ncbi:MAG TPA: DUF1326 domain-containing protein [Vicinamibacterales bacterium]|jgi:hypothetical protein|nr:DUF1326 domain-containing protein [Vicinamibacterales bacterium]